MFHDPRVPVRQIYVLININYTQNGIQVIYIYITKNYIRFKYSMVIKEICYA